MYYLVHEIGDITMWYDQASSKLYSRG